MKEWRELSHTRCINDRAYFIAVEMLIGEYYNVVNDTDRFTEDEDIDGTRDEAIKRYEVWIGELTGLTCEKALSLYNKEQNDMGDAFLNMLIDSYQKELKIIKENFKLGVKISETALKYIDEYGEFREEWEYTGDQFSEGLLETIEDVYKKNIFVYDENYEHLMDEDCKCIFNEGR